MQNYLKTLFEIIEHSVQQHPELIPHLKQFIERFATSQQKIRLKANFESFINLGGIVTHEFPIYKDFEEQAGDATGHYFHQDLLIASLISTSNPKRHIDIGSRIDGFVAHVASFREIEVLDVRDLKDTGHQNIKFLKANLMEENVVENNITDSISCLHAIEHFGLGRYGDPIDPVGYLKGFKNMVRMLKTGGTIYISFPIGSKNEVHFNAHRVFHPSDIFSWLDNDNTLKITRFDYVDDFGNLHLNSLPIINELKLNYGCGIYTFLKNS